MDKKKLTAENGRPIADNQNIQTAGKRGPVTLQDPWFLEKLAHFDREVIPERRMHAKGSGAYGNLHGDRTTSRNTPGRRCLQPRSASRPTVLRALLHRGGRTRRG